MCKACKPCDLHFFHVRGWEVVRLVGGGKGFLTPFHVDKMYGVPLFYIYMLGDGVARTFVVLRVAMVNLRTLIMCPGEINITYQVVPCT